ncbi:uncharacterized protein LOC112151254 [Oryzias melastigma]|uniref:uncharacterized protein LOC112151254 n=1 Tax=Oryzias melastigma TaxID=30732 RepID=UPI000CF8318D|nr:uncharacterized protein LOC112151254 [Oryzias melastigma]
MDTARDSVVWSSSDTPRESSSAETPKLGPQRRRKVGRKKRFAPQMALMEQEFSTPETENTVTKTVEEPKPTSNKPALIKETSINKSESSGSSGSKYDQMRQKEMVEIRKKNKALIERLVEDLISLILGHHKMYFPQTQLQIIQKWLFDRLWIEAETIHCHIKEEKFKGLDQVLYLDLCKLQRLEDPIVTYLEKREALFGDNVAMRFRKYMVNKPGFLKRVKSKMLRSQDISPRLMSSLDRPPQKKVTLKKVGEKRAQKPKKEEMRDMENCHLLLNEYLTKIIPCLFFKAHTDCSQENFNNMYQKLYEKLWDLCKSYNFKLKTANIDELCKKTKKELQNRIRQPEYFLLKGLNLIDPVSYTIFLHVFEKYMLKDKSKVAKFFSSIAKFLARPFNKKVFDQEGYLL